MSEVAADGEVCSDPVVPRPSLPASLLLAALALQAGGAAAFDAEFKPLGGVWDVDGGPIVYVLDPTGSADIGDDSELDALRDSFRAWACVQGTKLRFEEGSEPGPRVVATDDGKNTLFWDETGNDCLMGPGTLGVTVGDVGNDPRQAADICFNGLHHTWGVGKDTDVQSIALHEIGHFIGLDHPCDNDQATDTCIPVTQAIMFPSWSGSPERELLRSDVAGAVGLYPAGDGDVSGCEGPFRAGERCTCNDECVEGLVCAPDAVGDLRCGRTCSTVDRNCGAGSVCVFDAPTGDGGAVGLCVRAAAPDLPAGATCSNGTDCASGTCLAQFTIGSSICQVPCERSADCGNGTCFEGTCLGGFESEECPALDDGSCTCRGTAGGPGPLAGVGVGVLVVGLLRRRRSAA